MARSVCHAESDAAVLSGEGLDVGDVVGEVSQPIKIPLVKKIILAVFWAINISHAYALCLDGRHPNVEYEYSKSKYVVVATAVDSKTIVDVDDPAGIAATIYAINVENVYKGKPTRTLHLVSENTSGRFEMELGHKYLLFIMGEMGNFYIDNCGNSGLVKARDAETRNLKLLTKK